MTNNAPQSNDTAISALVAEPTSRSEIVSAYAALFSSVTTLFCCALPAFLVLLGFGLTQRSHFFYGNSRLGNFWYLRDVVFRAERGFVGDWLLFRVLSPTLPGPDL